MGFSASSGIDFTLPGGPPLVQPPLSLLDLAASLVDTQSMVEQLRIANEKAASAQEQLADLDGEVSTAQATVTTAQTAVETLTDEERDQPGAMDAVEDAKRFLAQLMSEYDTLGTLVVSAEAFASDLAKRVADLSRWESQFVYLPELSNSAAMSVFAPDSGTAVTDANLKPIGSNQAPASWPSFYWYDPFIAVGYDERSAFGWPNTDYASRSQRAERALRFHESWQVENEFWSGNSIPTNYHLTASPNTPTTSPHRTIDAWPNPTAAPGTVLGTAAGLTVSMAALDQAIADSEAGTGMIHATPYVIQCWMKTFPYIRDNDGKVYTVNHNLLVPGFGYGGTGPDQASRSETDGDGTSASTTFTSASAAFTAYDIGHPIVETSDFGVIPAGTVIASVTDGTTVVLSQPAGASHSSVHFTIEGTGGRATTSMQQWAYATEMVYTLRGDVMHFPYDLREMSPLLPVDNAIDVRAERTWACITNRFLRAAVLVDTTVA